jgi:hypothetical protein
MAKMVSGYTVKAAAPNAAVDHFIRSVAQNVGNARYLQDIEALLATTTPTRVQEQALTWLANALAQSRR